MPHLDEREANGEKRELCRRATKMPWVWAHQKRSEVLKGADFEACVAFVSIGLNARVN
jgi:hypothetical protein